MKTLRTLLGPLFLLLACPPAVMLFWYANVTLGGSLTALAHVILTQGLFATIYNVWAPVFFGSVTAWSMIAIFALLQLLLMKVIPGPAFHGPVTPMGNTPLYKANGVPSFVVTVILYGLACGPLHLFSPTLIYDHFGELLGALNLFSLLFCLALMIKGYCFPSTTDCGTSRNYLFDYYWGTELYPRVMGWDIKMFTNCRFALMSWPLIILSFAAKQSQLHGLSDSMVVAVLLQFVYVGKFFAWETGYLRSLDIMHDRAGFYICWGCLVWVPGIYTSSTLYLVDHPNHLGLFWSLFIGGFGIACILINYLADYQRQQVRATGGASKVWGKTPDLIQAQYTTSTGETKHSLLLASGWWGIARHFHYIPEILGAFCWSVPALFTNFSPYFYVFFLTLLLVDRAFRDDLRCAKKYGPSWQAYCQKVPYKIVPFVI